MTRIIACDESGAESDNLMRAKDAVFAHGSVNVDEHTAARLLNDFRESTRTQAPEIKSFTALRPKYRKALLTLLEALEDIAHIHLVDKSYFVCAKMVDLMMFGNRVAGPEGVYDDGTAAQKATLLSGRAPGAVGEERWQKVLFEFNHLLQAHQRKNASPPTVVAFFEAFNVARKRCRVGSVRSVLDEMWAGRGDVRALWGSPPASFREMDPMAPTLVAVAQAWRLRLGNVPFGLLVDNYSLLTPELTHQLVEAVRMPTRVEGLVFPASDLRYIETVDSRDDPRVQLADIVAGAGRRLGLDALNGSIDSALHAALHEMLDANVMAPPNSPLHPLNELRPQRYIERARRAGDL